MTTHTAALIKKIAAQIQSIGPLGHSIFRVALLTVRFGVFLFEHGPQPEFIQAVGFFFSGGGAAVTPVTARTAETLRLVYVEQLLIRMTHKRTRQSIRCFSRSARGHIFGFDRNRRSYAQMTNLAAVIDVVIVDADLMTEDGVIEFPETAFDPFNLSGRQDGQVVFEIVVALLAELLALAALFSFLAQQF